MKIKMGARFGAVALSTVVAGSLLDGCSTSDPSREQVSSEHAQLVTDPVPCDAWANAVVANSGSVVLNAASTIDSYSSSTGAYGGSNVGSAAIVRAATTITNNGAVVHGQLVSNAPSGLNVIPVPAGVTNLPLGASLPGSLNINTAGDSITLAPGNYVAANISVNAPGAIRISPAGQVRIWVTGTLNLGGSENANGSPHNLAFLVTSSNFVNVNSGNALYGAIYAPTSGVNLNSAVFGSVVGGSISLLNSGAAVHYDASAACPPPAFASTVPTPINLPAPPNVRGCYVGTWNGWKSTPCSTLSQMPPGVAPKPFIGGGQVVLPNYLDGGQNSFGPIPGIASSQGLRFGQVESTFVDVVASPHTEVNTPATKSTQPDCDPATAPFISSPVQQVNSLSLQANTNSFTPTSGAVQAAGHTAWVQFSIQSSGAAYDLTPRGGTQSSPIGAGFAICIWNNDFTAGKAGLNDLPNPSAPLCNNVSDCEAGLDCVQTGANTRQCLVPTYRPDCLASNGYNLIQPQLPYNLSLEARELQTLDYATVAASAFDDGKDSAHDLGMVAAMSWFDPNGNGKDYRGLFAVVTSDRYGLGTNKNWTSISGTALGLGNCGTATFPQGTMVYTSVQAGNCAAAGTPPPGVPATVTWPGQCANITALTSSPAPSDSNASLTDESNNLTILGGVASPLAQSADGFHYLETHYLATVDGQCVGTPHVYVKDHAQDMGSVPSNAGGQAFWESPDILIVEPGTAVTPDTPATETSVIAGHTYALYVRVHNEFACAAVPGVRARLWWGNAALAVPTWTDIITGGPDTANPNWSAMKPLPLGDTLDLIGPITWQAPSGVSPHECLLADIQSTGETMLTNIADTPTSNRIAQRNIEIGGVCAWTFKNGAQASTLGVTFTATDGLGNSYVLQPGDSAAVTFDDDKSGALFTGWNSHDHAGCTLTQATGKVTVTLLSGFGQCTVQGANIAANATGNVTSTVVPVQFSGTTINLGIATFFSNGGTLPPSPTNGATCSSSAQNGGPR